MPMFALSIETGRLRADPAAVARLGFSKRRYRPCCWRGERTAGCAGTRRGRADRADSGRIGSGSVAGPGLQSLHTGSRSSKCDVICSMDGVCLGTLTLQHKIWGTYAHITESSWLYYAAAV